MALKIRLRQQGRNNRQTYRLVVTDVRNKRDGKYLEKLGWYNPFLVEENAFVDQEKLQVWLGKGAEMSHDAKKIVAKVAPNFIKEWNEQRRKQRAKATKQRRDRRRATAKKV